MTIRLVDSGWGQELESALRANRSDLRIVCPFIKVRALDRLLALDPERVRVVTRFSLDEFALGVSDVEALGTLLGRGAEVRGIRHLHAKLYLFGTTRAIVASANLTDAGLNRNPELGIVTEDPTAIANCIAYFDNLWTRGRIVRPDQAADWTATVRAHQASGGRHRASASLGDFGADAGLPPPPAISPSAPFDEGEQAFVKFLGRSDNRVRPSWTAFQELERAGCHWAVAYPNGRRPRIVRDGDVMFIARLTDEPDTRIFGRAIALKHQPGRDDATDTEIADQAWRAHWRHYIRVYPAEFLNGTMGDGVSLRELMDALESDAFATTQENARRGHGNLDPRQSLRRQAAVRLSREGRAWLSERLETAFERHGSIPPAELDELRGPEPPAPGDASGRS